jgi:type II secretory pathway pseudopilin PulG
MANTRPRSTDPLPRAEREGGFSFLEATIASIMILMLAWLVATLTLDGSRAQKYAERQARVTEIAQDVVDEMRRGLGAAIRVFGDDLVGQGYRGRLDLQQGMPVPLASGRLPTIVAGAILEPEDPLLPRTGNELLFARYAFADEFTTSSGTTYRTDLYRLEYWFLTPAGLGPRRDRPDGLNLSRWISEPLADGTQVDRIQDPGDRAEVLLHLREQTPADDGQVHDAVQVVWLVGEDASVTGTFRSIDSVGEMSLTPPADRSPVRWVLHGDPELSDPDILIYRHHSVASVFAPDVMGVSRFSVPVTTGAGFPHGLEFQVVGPSAARQILLHLTLVSTNNENRRAYHDMQVVVDVRDL